MIGAGGSDVDTSSFTACLQDFNEELTLRTDEVVRKLERGN